MRFAIALTALLWAAGVQASGKITLQNNSYQDGKQRPMVGFGIYERFMGRAALNLWTGYGVLPLETREDSKWYVAKGQLDIDVTKKITMSPGLQYKNLIGEDFSDTNFYFRVDYKLWQ